MPFRTLLHCACVNGHLEIAKLLVRKGANIHTVDKDGRTPLHYACWYGHSKVAELLLKKGANTDAVNKNGQTPWNLALIYGFGDKFSELKRKLIYFKVGNLYQTTQNL